MDINGQYLRYEDYKLLGGTLDQTPFELLEFECRRRIDERTQNRLHSVESIPMEVKLCVNKMISCISKYESQIEKSSKGIASESIDGYSVSYIAGSQAESLKASEENEIEDIIRTYLLNVVVNGEHLLFLGVK